MMNITDIKVRKFFSENRLKALISITIDDELAIHDIKVIEGPERLFVAMPSRKEETGFRDVVHPISAEARNKLEAIILNAYQNALDELEHGENAPQEQPHDSIEDMKGDITINDKSAEGIL